VIATVNELEVAGMLKAVTVGAVVSVVAIVIVTLALLLVDTLPAASFAQAYSVFAPADEQV
jgi:hypothetical protein